MSFDGIYWIVASSITVVITIIFIVIIGGGIDDIGDFFDGFIEYFGWAVFLGCGALAAIIYGCIVWYWWAVLLICVPIIAIIVGLIIYFVKRGQKESDEYLKKREKEYEGGKKTKTEYKCPNCGGSINKVERLVDFDVKTSFECEHCGTVFNEKCLKLALYNKNEGENLEELTDWEEEYFEACFYLNLRPHNEHTQKQIDRQLEKIEAMHDDDKTLVEGADSWDEQELSESAYDFFSDNLDEINGYLSKNTPEDIKKKYDYFCSYYFDEQEDEDEG